MDKDIESKSKVDDTESFSDELKDFGQALFHSAVENPFNGVLQIVNHVTGEHLPPFDIVGAPAHDSLGAKLGAIVGTAIDVTVATVATGGAVEVLGGVGLAGSITTAAATGAIYGGIFQPSDPNSKDFFKDRLKNAGVDAITFGAMGGAAGILTKTGVFPVAEARTIFQSIKFGALSGGIGGAVGAEANAVIKEGKAAPTLDEFLVNVGSGALFGATSAGLGNALSRVGRSALEPIKANNSSGNASEARAPQLNMVHRAHDGSITMNSDDNNSDAEYAAENSHLVGGDFAAGKPANLVHSSLGAGADDVLKAFPDLKIASDNLVQKFKHEAIQHAF